MGIDIGIYPHSDRGDFLELNRNPTDSSQLGFGFDIKAVNSLFKSVSDFFFSFANAGKDTL